MNYLALIVSVPACLAIVNTLKPFMDAKFYPFASMFVGVMLSCFAWSNWAEVVARGLIVGLSAAGVYDMSQGRKDDRG